MESYYLFGAAKQSVDKNVYAAAAFIVDTNVIQKDYQINKAKYGEIEDLAGYSMIKTLSTFDFPTGEPSTTIAMIKRIKNRDANGGKD